MPETATDSGNQDPPQDDAASTAAQPSADEDALDARITRIVDQRLAAQSTVSTDTDGRASEHHDFDESVATPSAARASYSDRGGAASDRSTVSVPQSPSMVIEQDEAAMDDEALERAVRGSQTPDDGADPVDEPTMKLGSSAAADDTADTDTVNEPTLVLDRSDPVAVTGEPVSPAVDEVRDRHDRVDAIPTDTAKTSASATLALVFGVAAAICAFAPELVLLAVALGVLALLFGIIGTASARKPHVTGRALAVIGLLLGVVGMGIGSASIAGYEIDGVNDQSTADEMRQDLLDLRDRVADQLGL